MLRFFDCDIGVGGTGMGLPVLKTPEELLALMDRYAIERALVYDRGAVEAGVFDCFDGILAFCRGSDRLYPAIPVVPPATEEGPPPDELIEIIRKNAIAAARVFPRIHAFDFNPFSLGPLLERLQAHRVPVLYNATALEDHPWTHQPDWDSIREVALAFPALPIVVLWTGMLQGRRLFPLLAQCPNLLTDLTCASFQYIECVCKRFGSRRLVMASHHPINDPGLCIPWISYSEIPQQAKEDLAFNNAQRLVEAIQ